MHTLKLILIVNNHNNSMSILIDVSSQKNTLTDEIKRIKIILRKDDSAGVSRTGYLFYFSNHTWRALFYVSTYTYLLPIYAVSYTLRWCECGQTRRRGRYIFYYYCIFLYVRCIVYDTYIYNIHIL